MSKFGLEYREETGYDVGVYCEDNNWYFHQHYVEWLEQKIEALSQHDVIKNEVAVCDFIGHNNHVMQGGQCIECGSSKLRKQTVL